LKVFTSQSIASWNRIITWVKEWKLCGKCRPLALKLRERSLAEHETISSDASLTSFARNLANPAVL
jgi:hypothetical protein